MKCAWKKWERLQEMGTFAENIRLMHWYHSSAS